MNLHYRHTRNISNTREMERTVLALFESYQRLGEDSLNESLSTGRMSDFLFEADDAAVESSVKEARDAAMRSLDELEETGKTLNNSKAIAEFVKQLRQRLASVVLDSGKFRSIKDFAGITIKQISYIGDTLSQAIKSIDSAIDAMIASMDTLKIDWKSRQYASRNLETIVDLWLKKQADKSINIDKFKEGIKQKMLNTTQGGKGFFSTIMSLLKGASVEKITVSGDQFADDLLKCKPALIEQYLNGPLPNRAKGPPPVGEEIKKVVQTSGSDEKTIAAALPVGAQVSKFSKDEWSALLKKPDDLKDAINDRAKKLGVSGGIIERRGSAHHTAPVLVERWERLAGIRGDAR